MAQETNVSKLFSDDLVAGAAIRDGEGQIISEHYATETELSALETEISTILTDYTTNTAFTAHTTNTNNPHSVTKAQVGLGNVDNTSDSNKPVSTAAQSALDLKADKATTYTKGEVDALISVIPKFAIEVVDQLPTTDISPTTVYLVRDTTSGTNMYTEYIYVNNQWEMLGTQETDLSNYYTKTEIDTTVSTINTNISNLSNTVTSVSGRVTTLESTVTSLSERITTLETSKQDALSAAQLTALDDIVGLGLTDRTFAVWETES